MNKGFTLVELSIVLVIIGMLIGGILVAQSMIESTKIQSAVRDIQQYDVAVSNFVNNYKDLPGDSDKIAPAGNGDGYIDDIVAGGIPVCGAATCYERYHFWGHLSDTGMISEEYDYDATGTQWYPEFFDSNLSPLYSSTDSASYPIGHAYTSPYSGTSTGQTILSLDIKLDDGVSTTGDMRNLNDFITACLITDEICGTTIRMLSTSGRALDN